MTNVQTRYRLEVRLSITREEKRDGHGDYWQPTQERLSVEESIDLGSQDFLGITAILARLHESVTELRQHDRTITPPEILIERTATVRTPVPVSSETVAFAVGAGLHAETVEGEHRDGHRERLLQVGLALCVGETVTHYQVITSVDVAAALIAAIHANAKASDSLVALSAAVDQYELEWRDAAGGQASDGT